MQLVERQSISARGKLWEKFWVETREWPLYQFILCAEGKRRRISVATKLRPRRQKLKSCWVDGSEKEVTHTIITKPRVGSHKSVLTIRNPKTCCARVSPKQILYEQKENTTRVLWQNRHWICILCVQFLQSRIAPWTLTSQITIAAQQTK